MSETLEFFASAIPGTEKALCDELRELNFKSVRLNRGGIPFRGPWSEGWRACLESRIAQRIQILLARFPAPTEDALYNGVRKIDWSDFITPKHTLSVSSVSRGSNLNHSGFVALKTKDAIVDQVRTATRHRPDVDRDDPDLRVFMYLANNKAAVYLDLAGEPLHRRGYRTKSVEAPLRETLACAILRMSGWDRKTPLIDPMCGSGTIAIEAALWAANKAPGLDRKRFGFERWANFGDDEQNQMRELRGMLRGNVGQQPKIQACDIDENATELAEANAKRAGVRISIKPRSVLDLQAGGRRSMLVSNPPYGERLQMKEGFCKELAAVISRLHGWRVALLSGTKEYERLISAKPKSSVSLPNGDIDCDLLTYEIE
jgi:putative N6-adenine-specific DNA methylase